MRDTLKYFDKLTFMAMLFLVIIGIVLIYSASYSSDQSYWSKQLIRLILSIIIFFIVFNFKIEVFFKLGFFLYGFFVFVLFIQLLSNYLVAGTKSWIKLGFMSLQPSEFIKIPLAIIFAKILSNIDIIDWRVFFKLVLYLALPFGLIALQPDLGTAVMLLSFLLFAVLIKKIKKTIIIVSLILVVSGTTFAWIHVLKPYQKGRIFSFVNPEKYKKSSGYQVIQSKIALGSGGLTGKGYLKGSQSQYNFLPTRHTDFIISVLGEEFGFLGLSFLLMLYFILFYRQFNFRIHSSERFYFVFLFTGLIFIQFLVNTLMCVGYLPIMGVPLPFVSYGGSSLLAFFIGEALIFRVKIDTYLQ
jgi:rod shape determining protein RodA